MHAHMHLRLYAIIKPPTEYCAIDLEARVPSPSAELLYASVVTHFYISCMNMHIHIMLTPYDALIDQKN